MVVVETQTDIGTASEQAGLDVCGQEWQIVGACVGIVVNPLAPFFID